MSLKPLRLLQTDDLYTKLNAFIANSTGGLLTLYAHGYGVDHGNNFSRLLSTKGAN